MLVNYKKYNPLLIEPRVQKYWEDRKLFEKKEDCEDKFYCVSMLPYPSGDLHMGHIRNYTIGDVIARYQTICGKNVMQPIGWDAFGLPAENAAIKNKIHPALWTEKNISNMRRQLKSLGYSFDWSRELKTCDPSYYKWDQWLFIKLYQKNMAYKRISLVNWDPVDETVLANEQVIDGRGWRSGALVQKKEIDQWFLRITNYSEELLNGLNNLRGWPEYVKQMQKNWIGKSQEIRVDFKLCSTKLQKVSVYMKRIELLFGATCLFITHTNKLIEFIKSYPEISEFLQECKYVKNIDKISLKGKKILNTGIMAINPVSKIKIPVYIVNFLEEEDSETAIAFVPAHNDIDHDIAKKYHLPIIPVFQPEEGWDFSSSPYLGEGYVLNNNRITSQKLRETLLKKSKEEGYGCVVERYKLRDWIVSRQRNWGTPIPIIYCDRCGVVPVHENDLPVILPYERNEEDLKTKCYICQGIAKRETDTMDTFVESSWYYLRYCSPNYNKAITNQNANYWMPVDQYIGGREHSVMHLLYARFIYKVLRDEGILKGSEPFKNLLTQGMVLKNGEKMSKSRGNCVSPEELLQKYGADTLRFFIIFSAPPEQDLEWSEGSIVGSYRFLNKIWDFSVQMKEKIIKQERVSVEEQYDNNTQKILLDFNKNLKKMNKDIKNLHLNTFASSIMKMFSLVEKMDKTKHSLISDMFSAVLRALSPISPHITQTLWKDLNYGENILSSNWPEFGFKVNNQTHAEIAVQIDGKTRGNIKVSLESDEKEIIELISKDAKLAPYISNQIIKKVFLIGKKLINIVLV